MKLPDLKAGVEGVQFVEASGTRSGRSLLLPGTAGEHEAPKIPPRGAKALSPSSKHKLQALVLVKRERTRGFPNGTTKKISSDGSEEAFRGDKLWLRLCPKIANKNQ